MVHTSTDEVHTTVKTMSSPSSLPSLLSWKQIFNPVELSSWGSDSMKKHHKDSVPNKLHSILRKYGVNIHSLSFLMKVRLGFLKLGEGLLVRLKRAKRAAWMA
jgi:hypothetical protein